MIAVCNQMSYGGSGLALHPLRFTFCYPHSLFLCKQLKPAEMQLDRLGLGMKMRLSKPKRCPCLQLLHSNAEMCLQRLPFSG